MAYKVTHEIPFVDINDIPCVIKISQDISDNPDVIELIPGANPIIVNYNDEENIYNPLRFAGATITVLVEETLFDLYAASPHQFKVDFYKGEDLKYTGFITPEVFSQDYNGYLAEFQIETISALATLEYYRIDPSRAESTYFKLMSRVDAPGTVYGILNSAFRIIPDSYDFVYMPKIFNAFEREYSLQNLDCLIGNFIDDDEEYWTYKDFLEEFCKFFGWTLTEKDGSVYFIDLDYIKAGYNQYFSYNGSMSEENPAGILEISTQFLSEKDITGSNNSVEILPAYNKIVVIDSDYEFVTSFPKLDNLILLDNGRYLNLFRKVHSSWTNTNANQSWIIYRYLPTNKNVTLFVYEKSGTGLKQLEEYPSTWQEIDQYAGSSVQRHQRWNRRFEEVEWEYGPVYVFKNFVGSRLSTGEYEVSNPKATTNTLLMGGGVSGTWSSSEYPCLQLRVEGVYAYNTYLQLNFEMAASHYAAGVFTDLSIYKEDKFKDVTTDDKGYRVPCELKFGDHYWNGSKWTTTRSVFPIEFEFGSKDHACSGWFKKIIENQNNYSTRSGFKDGYVIPITTTTIEEDRALMGDITLTMYFPRYTWNRNAAHAGSAFAFVKNLEINLDGDDKDPYVDARQDTVFENYIEGDYINPHDDIELKITTNIPGKAVKSYSKLFENSMPVSNLTHLGIKDYTDGTNQSYNRPEHHLVYKYLGQYNRPKLKLTQDTNTNYNPYQFIEDSGFPGRKFMITNEEINYRDNMSNLTMQEIIE